jgi:hypothetical protein
MNDEQRRRILEQARATLDRPAFEPREAPVELGPRRNRRELRESAPRAEPEPLTEYEQARAGANHWRDFIVREARSVTMEAAKAIGESVAEALRERDGAIASLADRLAKSERRADSLELRLARSDVTLAKIEVQLAQAAVDADRRSATELPPPSRRSPLN